MSKVITWPPSDRTKRGEEQTLKTKRLWINKLKERGRAKLRKANYVLWQEVYCTCEVTFSAVRFHTVTTWPIFSKFETIPLPIRPSPRKPILFERRRVKKKDAGSDAAVSRCLSSSQDLVYSVYLLSVGVMLPLRAVLSAAWMDVDLVSWTS